MIGKNKDLNFFDKLILWLNYGAVLTLLLGYLAPMVDPRTFWVIAFFGLAYPPVLLVNVIFILYWLLRRRAWALLSLAAILIGWKVLNSNIGFRMPTVKDNFLPDSNTFRLMTYNVHDFKKYGEANDVSTRNEILDIIKHEQPDVIGIEEFYSRSRGKYANVDSIKKILKTDYCYHRPFAGSVEDGIGIALFSKLPIIDTGVIWLKENDHQDVNQCIYADIKKNGKMFRFYAVHLQSIRFDPEDYQYLSEVSRDGKPDVSSSKRIGGKLKKAYLKRAEQVDKIRQHAAQCPYPYIIAGDFNDTPSSYAVSQMAKGLKNTFYEKGSGLGRTYNGSFPNYQIDYILAGSRFDVLSYGIVRKKLSDHYPIFSDLRLR